MTNVKRVFFITRAEAEKIRKEIGDAYIMEDMPHYELEDGTIMYGGAGAPATYERFYTASTKSQSKDI